VRVAWISGAAVASRCSSPAAGKPILAIVAALLAQVPAAASKSPALAPDSGLVLVAAAYRSPAEANDRVRGLQAEVAATLLEIFNPVKQRTRSPRADMQVSAAAVVVRELAVAAAREWVVVAVAAEVAVAVVADGDRISRSSTTSFFSVISPTALATIASAITATTALMSA
jgi:hypothetical protein